MHNKKYGIKHAQNGRKQTSFRRKEDDKYKENMVRVLDGIKDYVDGIECYHYTSIEDNKTEFLIDFCKKNNLMISGGSDFHYNIPNNNKSHINGLGVPAKYFDLIKAKLENKSQSY